MLHGSGSSAGRVPLLDQGPQGNWGPRLYHQLRGGCWFRNCVNISVSLATSIVDSVIGSIQSVYSVGENIIRRGTEQAFDQPPHISSLGK